MSEDKNEQLGYLAKDISESVNEFRKSLEYKKGRPSLALADPAKTQEVLLMRSVGTSRQKITEATGASNATIARLESEFADHLESWKEIGGTISGALFMDATSTTSEVLEKMAKAVEAGEGKTIEALSKALGSLNKTVEVSHRQAMTARGEASQITREEKVATMEDVDKAAEDALKLIQEAEVVDD